MTGWMRHVIVMIGVAVLVITPVAVVQADGMKRAPSSTSADERALDRYHQGRRAMDEGDLLIAARYFREAVSLDRGLLSARRAYARILMATERPGRAQSVLAEGLEIVPDDLPTARLLARIARGNNDTEMAIRALEAIRPPADSPETQIRSHLGDLYRHNKQYAKAAAVYAELRAVQPSAPEWILGEAISHDRHGEAGAAREAWSALLKQDGVDKSVHRYAENRRRILRNGEVPYGD